MADMTQIYGLIGLLIALSIAFLFLNSNSSPKAEAPKAKKSLEKRTNLTKEEVAKHNKKTDLWIIVSGKVYDITDYIDDHPGGDAILNQAGGDNTEIMAAPQHPVSVYDVLATYYIGDLQG